MNQEQNVPEPSRETVLRCNIMIAIHNFKLEELEAIERYCSNYHHAYQKPGKKYIITEITIEPMKKAKRKYRDKKPRS